MNYIIKIINKTKIKIAQKQQLINMKKILILKICKRKMTISQMNFYKRDKIMILSYQIN